MLVSEKRDNVRAKYKRNREKRNIVNNVIALWVEGNTVLTPLLSR